MRPELVRVFEEDLRPQLHENPTLDAEPTDAVTAVLRRHVSDFVVDAGVEHLVAAVRSDDVDEPERHTCVFTGSEQEALTLLTYVALMLAAGVDEAEEARAMPLAFGSKLHAAGRDSVPLAGLTNSSRAPWMRARTISGSIAACAPAPPMTAMLACWRLSGMSTCDW